ncbi:class I adenylate-forming enzyme family protein [Amycolatopsis sp. cg13]|uniref:class I adenylate-forming enzyme family protein n=1 Tax=Amycolatopsis sp. cg13 TaxID=3238807 RepID=UPI003524A386
MSLSADPLQALTAPGGPCELRTETVLGVPMTVFAHRARSLGEVLAASARHGEREYLVTADRRITFAAHARQVASVACALREDYGIGKGDRVAIAAANSPEWVVAFWATVSLGAIAVGCNAWWSRRELEYALGHTRPSLVVADAKRAALLDGVPVLTVEEDIPRLARRSDAPLPSCAVEEDDPAVILYTSGTTGRPKGAVHTHRNLTSVIEFHRLNSEVARALGDLVDPSARRYLLGVPLFHIAGLHNLVVPRLADGSAVVLHQGGFDAERVLRLVEAERVTNWGVVPTMAHRLLEHGNLDRYDLSSLTAFTLGAAPSSPAFQQRLRAELPVAEQGLVDSYGLTESSTAISVATSADLAASPGTVGHPIATVELEIRDAFGELVPDGGAGEICVRSPFTMLGYWEDPEATAAAIDDQRWLHTGDIGVLSGGQLRLTARRSDLILHGGENVYPAEVENVLAEHPAVRECIVLGVPHVDLGQEVAAVVVVSASVGEEELRAFAAERLAYFKVPSRWRIGTEPLPRNVTGKVVRNQVPRP